jgi:2,3,4,5-tetrahydropyridine-2,6-dicarboxylate N-succinyltransferase
MTSDPAAFGVGVASVRLDRPGEVLDVAFAVHGLGDEVDEVVRPLLAPGGVRYHDKVVLDGLDLVTRDDEARRVGLRPVVVSIAELDGVPTSVADAYLRLHLLSSRRARPRSINLDGIFGILPNVAWTDAGPCHPDHLDDYRLAVRLEGRHVVVHGLDKFPRMLDYVTPSGVRVADASRVRLGAHLAQGTTVMHEGYVNFNAGTLGPSMVEGRISQGVVVGANSDVGGGASIMGTLSGGGKETVSVGERCLLGANSGLGISLGDDCTVEAGLYLTAGSLVKLPDGSVVKARELNGASGLLYRRHSQTGAIEAVAAAGTWSGLNPTLHAP